MIPIEKIVQELKRIPRALQPPHLNLDPSGKPRVTVPVTGRLEDMNVIPSVPDEWAYPEWVEREAWPRIDDAVTGKESGAEGRVGIDVLAWYVSFHLSRDPNTPGQGRLAPEGWGVFIPVSSLSYLEQGVFAGLTLDRQAKWNLAFQLLLLHELMHFAVDYACAQWELLLQTPCWAALQHRMKAEQVAYLAAEEQLANAYMLRRCRSFLPRLAADALMRFVARQPRGYRDGPRAAGQATFVRVFADVVKSYAGVHAVERGLAICADSYDLGRHLPAPLEIESGDCPVHVIHDEGIVGLPEPALQLITRIPSVTETDGFRHQFARLGGPLQRRWERLKAVLRDGIPRSARFTKMKTAGENVYSLRLNDNFRVHVRLVKGSQDWEAFGVGSHAAMGHG